MFFRLFLLFTITPMVELYLLIKIGQFVGAWETILMVIVMGLAGAALARSQGLAVIGRFQQAISKGDVPTDPILDGILVLAGGALLVTPGVLTDFLGISMVAPPTRRIYREYLKKRVTAGMRSGAGFNFHYYGPGPDQDGRRTPEKEDDVIDV